MKKTMYREAISSAIAEEMRRDEKVFVMGEDVAITGGVGEALIATAFGLCVAILALAVHSYFTQRLDRIITDMEMCFSALETMPVKAGQ